jgi:hypothetical protein
MSLMAVMSSTQLMVPLLLAHRIKSIATSQDILTYLHGTNYTRHHPHVFK